MTTKKMLCLVLVVSLIAGVSGLALNTGEASAQGWYDAFTMGRDLVAIASGATNIWDFLSGGGPDPAIMKKLDEINNRLIAIQQSLDDIKKDLGIVYQELQDVKKYDVLQTAWATTPRITEKYRGLQEFYAEKPESQKEFDDEKKAFDNWVTEVLPKGPGGMDVDVNAWYQALVNTLPGAEGSALDLATKQAILKCETDSPAQDFSALVESTNGVPIVAERPMYFNYNQEWTGGHTEGGILEPAGRFYFAEGTLRPGFVTYYCVQNPWVEQAEVKVTYIKGDGTTAEQKVSIPPLTRMTVCPELVIESTDGPASDFSAIVESTNGVDIVAERPTYFYYQGRWDGGTADGGCTDTSDRFYFAEGTTRPDFDTYFCIMNPDEEQADVKLTYAKGDGTAAEQTLAVPPRTRSTVRASDLLGSSDDVSCDFSTVVESTNGVPIVAERPVYFDYQGQYPGGHSETGLVEPAEKFYLAEGTTRPGFESFICLFNANDVPSETKITYMKGDGTTAVSHMTVPARTRSTVRASDMLGSSDDASSDFSAVVESTDGTDIVVERPMYFSYKGAVNAGSCEPGITETTNLLYFAEGNVRDNFDSYFCLQNPGHEAAQVRITYMKGDASVQEQMVTVPPRTRSTVSVDLVYESPNDLMGVYETYLESLFWGSFTYQALGARMICDALDKDPSLLPWGKDYMSKRFYPEIVGPEVDEFLSCVERLVCSQIYIGPDNLQKPSLNDQGYHFADKTDEVLKRANFFASQALGQPNALRGTMIATEDVGGVTKVTARPVNHTEPGDAPVSITSKDIPYMVKAPDGMGVEEGRYHIWTGAWDSGQLSTSNKFNVVRYNFSNITDVGDYEIIDTEGHLVDPGTVLCQAQVEDMPLTDPTDPTKVEHAKYGHFLTVGQRLGPEFMSSTGVLQPAKSVDYLDKSLSKVEPYQDYRYHVWAYAKSSGQEDVEHEAFAQNVRTFTFTDPQGQDRRAKVSMFLNYGSYVYVGEDNSLYSENADAGENFLGAQTVTDVWLHDLTTGDLVNMGHFNIKSTWGYYQDDCRDVALQTEVTLKHNHQYELYPRVWAQTTEFRKSSQAGLPSYTPLRFEANAGLLVTNTYIVLE